MTDQELKEKIAFLFKNAREEGAILKWADGVTDAEEVMELIEKTGWIDPSKVVLPSNQRTGGKMEAKKICSCGMPQSYPIPHEHDLTDREKLIKEASFKAGQESEKAHWAKELEQQVHDAFEGGKKAGRNEK